MHLVSPLPDLGRWISEAVYLSTYLVLSPNHQAKLKSADRSMVFNSGMGPARILIAFERSL